MQLVQVLIIYYLAVYANAQTVPHTNSVKYLLWKKRSL